MLLRWQSKPRFDASRPASGRLPANCFHFRRRASASPSEPSIGQATVIVPFGNSFTLACAGLFTSAPI